MFDQFKAMGAMAGLMKDLPRIKARMESIKAELETLRIGGSAGGGAVRAEVTGTLKVVAIEIDPALFSSGTADRAFAEQLIAEAVNTALDAARTQAEDTMRRAAEELGIPLPAGGMAGLLG